MNRKADWPSCTIMPARWRNAWSDWFQQHGVNPSDVMTPGWVEADDDKRTITYLGVVRDEQGDVMRTADGAAVKQSMTVQLIDPAAPMPWNAR